MVLLRSIFPTFAVSLFVVLELTVQPLVESLIQELLELNKLTKCKVTFTRLLVKLLTVVQVAVFHDLEAALGEILASALPERTGQTELQELVQKHVQLTL